MFKLAEPSYVILYPSLLGGEFIAYTLSVCLPNYNHNIMKWDNNRAIVNCPFGFSEELHRDFDQQSTFPADYSKPFILRDHISPRLGMKYSDFDPKLTPIVLITTNPEMWFDKRVDRLYTWNHKDEITLEFIKKKLGFPTTQERLDEIKDAVLGDSICLPDLTMWARDNKPIVDRTPAIRRRDHTRYMRQHLLNFLIHQKNFDPLIIYDMDNVYRNLQTFVLEWQRIFPDLNTDKFTEYWREWLERNS